MYIDTHAHFDHLPDDESREVVLNRARAAGVERIIAIGASPKSNRLVYSMARTYRSVIAAAVGYDRDMAMNVPSLDEVLELAGQPEVVAIGEIGLDYFYSQDTAAQQRRLFEKMLNIAAEVRKPVIVHSRKAEADTLAVLKDWQTRDRKRVGVLHCFTGGADFAEKLLEMGFYIGLSGILTFPNACTLRDLAAWLPLDQVLLETDSPYLAPVPLRGQTNEPANIVYVAACLAQIRHDSVEQIAHSTSQNAVRLFQLAGDRSS